MPINYKEYPANWKTEIRPAVLKRANNCCEVCGVKNHSLIYRFGKGIKDWVYWPCGMESEAWSLDGRKATKIILTVAHLDHDKSNDGVRLERLKAMCQKCHFGYDLKRNIVNKKYGKDHEGKNLKLPFVK